MSLTAEGRDRVTTVREHEVRGGQVDLRSWNRQDFVDLARLMGKLHADLESAHR